MGSVDEFENGLRIVAEESGVQVRAGVCVCVCVYIYEPGPSPRYSEEF